MRTGFYLAVLVVGALNSLPAAHASAGGIAGIEALLDEIGVINPSARRKGKSA